MFLYLFSNPSLNLIHEYCSHINLCTASCLKVYSRIGRFQNRNDWNDISFRGCSQSQFNYHDQFPQHDWDFRYAGGTYVPDQTSGPTIPAVGPLHQPQPAAYCNICEVKLGSYKSVEEHNNGKKHRRMLNLREELERLRISNGQIPNSQVNLVVQPKTVLKSGKNGCPEKNVSSEATVAKHRNYLQKDIGITPEVPAEGKPRDNTSAQGHNFKRKIDGAKTGKYMKTNDGLRRPMDSSKHDINSLSYSIESPVKIPALTPQPAVASDIIAPSPVVGSSFKLVYQQVLASQTQVLEVKEYHEIQNPIVETNDHPHAPADSNIYTQPEDVSSDPAARALRPPKVGYCKICEVHLPNCKILEMHNKGKRHRRMLRHQKQLKLHEEIQRLKTSNGQIPNSQKNLVVQPKTVQISGKNGHPLKNMSSEASISKHKNYLPKGMGLTSEIPAKAPEVKLRDNSAQGHGFKHKIRGPKAGKSSFELQSQQLSASQIPVSEHKEHYEIQNPTAEMTDQLHAPADSNINTQTEDMSSDSAVIPQLSKDAADCESQNCTDEKNNQLLPSVVVEFNSPSGSSTNTLTADGCSEAEQKMDILTHQSGTTQLSKVAVCLNCGDVGFPETLVFCNMCQVYALHRYCLDGPVIFTDDVTWFCEDCEPKVVEASFHDNFTLLPSGKNVSLNSGNDASQARIEPKNCIACVKNKQGQQNIAAKTMVLLSDNHSLSHHGLSQCSNNTEKENKFEKECQPVPKDQANTGEGSLNATVPHPIADPVWRGSLRLFDPSFGTVIGLLAHMSTLACPKVLEETRLFPDVLSPDLLPRSKVWPKPFMKCGPNVDSIALYFFPDSQSVERAYDKLVDDMTYFDLSIRAVVENAELLVFPSILLPIQCRRFQEKYYLWGVFRAKKTSE